MAPLLRTSVKFPESRWGKKNTNLMLRIWVDYYWQVFSYLLAKDLCQMTALHLGWLQHLPGAAWSPACQHSITPSPTLSPSPPSRFEA